MWTTTPYFSATYNFCYMADVCGNNAQIKDFFFRLNFKLTFSNEHPVPHTHDEHLNKYLSYHKFELTPNKFSEYANNCPSPPPPPPLLLPGAYSTQWKDCLFYFYSRHLIGRLSNWNACLRKCVCANVLWVLFSLPLHIHKQLRIHIFCWISPFSVSRVICKTETKNRL